MKKSTLLMAMLFLALNLVGCTSKKYEVKGTSMEPNYLAGQMIIVDKVALTDLKRGDVIVYEIDGKNWFKRLVGLPGETVEYRDGQVYIDGEVLDEPYLDPSKPSFTYESHDPILLGENEFYVLGDNRNFSNDSRNIGAITGEMIIGRVGP